MAREPQASLGQVAPVQDHPLAGKTDLLPVGNLGQKSLDLNQLEAASCQGAVELSLGSPVGPPGLGVVQVPVGFQVLLAQRDLEDKVWALASEAGPLQAAGLPVAS